MQEIWKELWEYPNYEVSNTGKVRMNCGDGTYEEVEPYSDFEIIKVKLMNQMGVDEVALGYLIMREFDPYRGPGGWSPIVYLDEDPWNCSMENMRWKKKNMRQIYEAREKKYDEDHKVYCYENDTVYENATVAARELGVDRTGVCKCCLENIQQFKNYHFSYLRNKEKLKDRMSNGTTGTNRGRKVYCKNLEDGSIRIFSSQKEAIEELNLPSIKQVLSGRQRTAGNYVFSYNKEDVL